MMVAGSSVTYTHCSVRFKVTSGLNRRIHMDVGLVADVVWMRRRREKFKI
jgi:hypothetical protein